MRKGKRIILVGHAASGKDHLADRFIERGFRKDVSLTTRPIRANGEVDGLTYHYVSEEQFMRHISDNKFYENVLHNNWRYGTLKTSWDTSDVFIMTPSGVASIDPDDRKDCTIVFIEIPEHIRRERMKLRSDADKTERRLEADKKDFKGFIDYDYRIKNPSFGADIWINIISRHSK